MSLRDAFADPCVRRIYAMIAAGAVGLVLIHIYL